MQNELNLADYTRRDFVKTGVAGLAAASVFKPERVFAGTQRSYTFVEETDSDNGYDSVSNFVRFGTKRAKSVKDMVDQILAEFQEGDCIKSLTIIGHGAPGNISIGNGQSGTDSAKEIDGNNENVWGPELDRLACKFCDKGVVYLRGCNVGAEDAGANKLFKIKQHLKCAIVQAPSGVCNPLWTTGDDQTVSPGDANPPKSIPNPDKGKKKKDGQGEISRILGADLQSSFTFDPLQITAARMLPRVLGQPFSVDLIATNGVTLPPDVLSLLRSGLNTAAPIWYPECGFSLDAYLQVQLAAAPTPTGWIPPGALIGGSQYYSPFREDTSATYVLPDDLVAALQALAGYRR